MLRGFVLTGLVFVILVTGIASVNYLFVSHKDYEKGISQDMLIDGVLNAHQDMKNVVALGQKNIISDAVVDTIAGGCSITSTELKGEIVNRIDAAFQNFNSLLSSHAIILSKNTLTVTASVSPGKKCSASATVVLDFIVTTTDGSVKKTGHLDTT